MLSELSTSRKHTEAELNVFKRKFDFNVCKTFYPFNGAKNGALNIHSAIQCSIIILYLLSWCGWWLCLPLSDLGTCYGAGAGIAGRGDNLTLRLGSVNLGDFHLLDGGIHPTVCRFSRPSLGLGFLCGVWGGSALLFGVGWWIHAAGVGV